MEIVRKRRKACEVRTSIMANDPGHSRGAFHVAFVDNSINHRILAGLLDQLKLNVTQLMRRKHRLINMTLVCTDIFISYLLFIPRMKFCIHIGLFLSSTQSGNQSLLLMRQKKNAGPGNRHQFFFFDQSAVMIEMDEEKHPLRFPVITALYAVNLRL